MDLTLDYDITLRIYNELGKQDFLNFFSSMYSNKELYSFSLDWTRNKKLILKLRGKHGDIIVGWK